MTQVLGVSDKDYYAKGKLREIYQSVFMIHKVIIVHHETSLPVFEKNLVNSKSLESSMITSILQAISSIGQEMLGLPTGFKKLEFHGFVITGVYNDGFSIYVFSETELVKEIVQGMHDFIKWFSHTFCSLKKDWDGSLNVYKMSKNIINAKISQNLFLWLLYPLEVSKNQYLDTSKLSLVAKYILKCIEMKSSCTVAVIFDEFNEHEEEKILFEIFNLAIEGYLKTGVDD